MNDICKEQLTGQSVLFITTKNLDYIRNSQEIALIKKYAASCRIIGSNSSSYAKRLLYVWFQLFIISMKPYTVIFTGFAPQLTVPFFYYKMKHAFLIEDFFISLYDTFVFDRQKFSKGSLPGRLLFHLDRLTIQKADLVISDTCAHGSYFCDTFSADSEKMHTLYLNADTTIYYRRPYEKPADAPKTVLYFGSILPLQGLPWILDAIDSLKDRKDLHFHIIGPIPDSAARPESTSITYTKWLSQPELARAIAKADLCIAGHFHPTIGKASRTIPGKAYIYEAMGKPMILGDNAATRELQDKWTVPALYIPMGNSQALADCIVNYFFS